jgi:transcriptional regulator with XRE-family HTH domain
LRKQKALTWKRPFVSPPPEMGRIIKEARTRLGLTTRQLARLAGISQPFVSNLEAGDRSPLPKTARKLEAILGVSVPMPAVDVSQTAAGRAAAKSRALEQAAELARRAAVPRLESYWPSSLERWGPRRFGS